MFEDRLIFISMKSQHPVHIQVFTVVISNGDIMTLFFFLGRVSAALDQGADY